MATHKFGEFIVRITHTSNASMNKQEVLVTVFRAGKLVDQKAIPYLALTSKALRDRVPSLAPCSINNLAPIIDDALSLGTKTPKKDRKRVSVRNPKL